MNLKDLDKARELRDQLAALEETRAELERGKGGFRLQWIPGQRGGRGENTDRIIVDVGRPDGHKTTPSPAGLMALKALAIGHVQAREKDAREELTRLGVEVPGG